MTDEAPKPDSGQPGSVLEVIERLTGAAPRVDLRREESAPEPAAANPPSRTVPQSRGNYRLLGEIARGGMGVVLRGRDQDLRREVALKVLHPDLARRPDSVQRFVEEAQISGQLQHPGVAPVYELGLLADERPYFTMKLIRGRTFADLLLAREESTSDRRRMLDIFLSVCQTIAYVHSRGVIHRDLKPANVMVGAFGEVQVVDWGLAKVLAREAPSESKAPTPPARRGEAAREDSASTWHVPDPIEVDARDSRSLSGAIMGTLAYMPPEQARGEVDSLDERADVFALGAILCEILTGGAPYSSSTPRAAVEAARGLLGHAFEALERAQAEPDLVALCKQCLSADRNARPRDAQELVTRVQAHFEGLEQRARAAQIEAAEARVKAAEERRARRLTAGLATSVVLTVLLAGAAWGWSRTQREAREQATRDEVEAALTSASAAQATNAWDAAVSQVQRARTALQAGVRTPALVARVEQTAAVIEQSARAAQLELERIARNETLLDELERIRSFEGRAINDREELTRRDTEFVAAFRRWGVEIDNDLERDVVERIVASGAALEIGQALDQWCWRRVLALRGWKPPAERLNSIAIASDPDPERVAIRRALAARDLPALLELSERAKQTPLPPASAVSLAVGLLGHQRLQEASGVLATSVELFPSDFALHRQLGFAFDDMGPQFAARAREHYMAALALRPNSVHVLRGLGNVAHDSGDVERAQAYYHRVLAINPEHYATWNDLATTLTDLVEQERCLRRALELAPELPEPKTNLGRLLHMTGRAAEAVVVLREAVAAAPYSHFTWGHLGTALARTGDREGAIEAYEQALERNGEDISTLYNLALELRSSERFEQALERSMRAFELAPEHPLLQFGMGASLLQLGREAEALPHLERAFAADSKLGEALSLRARLLAGARDESLHDPIAAISAAEMVLAAAPAQLDMLLARALAKLRLGEAEQALEACSGRPAPTSALGQSLECVRGLALIRLGRRDEARAALDELEVLLDEPGDAFSQLQRDRLLEELRSELGP